MDYLYILREALVWIITIFWLYQLLVSLCSLVKIKDKPLKVKKDHRFMAIIPAHNEEADVGNLIESLKNQSNKKKGGAMSSHHGHDHSHAVVTEDNAKKLTFALILTSSFLVIEVIAGFITQSLALLSDAAHMFTDAAALAIAISVLGGAIAQGKTASTALEGIARNPAASGKLLIPMILGLALIESLVIYALIIALGLK